MVEKIFEKIIDNLIDEARPQIIEKLNNEKIDDDIPDVEFSEEHNQKMEKIFSMAKKMEDKPKKNKIAKRKVAVLVAAVILVTGLAITSCGALPKDFIKRFLNIHDDFSTIIYNKVNGGNSYLIDGVYFGYIPNEFELKENDEYSYKNSIEFLSKSDKEMYIKLELYIEKWKTDVNYESGDFVEHINNKKDMAYSENDENKILNWQDGNYFVTLITNGNKEDLLEVAEKIEIRK